MSEGEGGHAHSAAAAACGSVISVLTLFWAGMDLVAQLDLGSGTDWGFSLYFLTNLTPEQRKTWPTDIHSKEAAERIKDMYQPVLELTHNHGTELVEGNVYHDGNSEEEGAVRGFGHTGFLGACAAAPR